MIHIKCKNCGRRFPFSSKKEGYSVRSQLKKNGLKCPDCDQILIKSKNFNR